MFDNENQINNNQIDDNQISDNQVIDPQNYGVERADNLENGIYMDNQNFGQSMNENDSKMKKVAIITIAVIMAITAVTIVLIVTKPMRDLKKHLNLGQKYLDEMNYEEAIISFQASLKIDPMNEEALEGIKEAYIGYIDELRNDDIDEAIDVAWEAYEFLDEDEDMLDIGVDLYIEKAADQASDGDYDAAIATLEEGADKYDSDRLRDEIEKYREMKIAYEHQLEQEKLLAQIEDSLQVIAMKCSQNDWDGVFEYMNSVEYNKFLEVVPKLDSHSAIDTGYGLIGIYKIDDADFGEYMLYYGDYDGNVRSGHGYWFGYYNGNNYIDDGQWANDAPNGYQSVREWYSALDESVTYRVLTGPVTDGKWDGEMTWGFETGDGFLNWGCRFNNGTLEVQGYDDDGNPRMDYVGLTDSVGPGGLYFTRKEDLNSLWGITGFASH